MVPILFNVLVLWVNFYNLATPKKKIKCHSHKGLGFLRKKCAKFTRFQENFSPQTTPYLTLGLSRSPKKFYFPLTCSQIWIIPLMG